jgi:hypothetical protein
MLCKTLYFLEHREYDDVSGKIGKLLKGDRMVKGMKFGDSVLNVHQKTEHGRTVIEWNCPSCGRLNQRPWFTTENHECPECGHITNTNLNLAVQNSEGDRK